LFTPAGGKYYASFRRLNVRLLLLTFVGACRPRVSRGNWTPRRTSTNLKWILHAFILTALMLCDWSTRLLCSLYRGWWVREHPAVVDASSSNPPFSVNRKLYSRRRRVYRESRVPTRIIEIDVREMMTYPNVFSRVVPNRCTHAEQTICEFQFDFFVFSTAVDVSRRRRLGFRRTDDRYRRLFRSNNYGDVFLLGDPRLLLFDRVVFTSWVDKITVHRRKFMS